LHNSELNATLLCGICLEIAKIDAQALTLLRGYIKGAVR
jgi:hypothetical protein